MVFDAPTKDWAGRRNAPTIDVYLYDIREDLRRRERGLINEYDDDGRVTARRLPPRFFKLSYLVTAWTQRPEDEHRLLSALLRLLPAPRRAAGRAVTGPLAELGLPVPVTVGLPPPEDRSFADVWTALGGELKPSLDVGDQCSHRHRAAVSRPGRRSTSRSPLSVGGTAGWPSPGDPQRRRAPREPAAARRSGGAGRPRRGDGAPGRGRLRRDDSTDERPHLSDADLGPPPGPAGAGRGPGAVTGRAPAARRPRTRTTRSAGCT